MDPASEQPTATPADQVPPPEPEAASLSDTERFAIALTLAMLLAIATTFLLRASTGELRSMFADVGRTPLYDGALIATLLALIVPIADLIGRILGQRQLLRLSGPWIAALLIAWVACASILPPLRDAQRISNDAASWTRSLDLPERTIASTEPARRICAANPVLPYRGSDPPPWQGRTALPVDGPDVFIADVQHVLDDLAAYAPQRYREALEYLPQADWDPTWLDLEFGPGQAAAASNGKFAIDADDYGMWQFTRVFLHEVGHNVRQHLTAAYLAQGLPERQRSERVERNADEYAATVLGEIQACQAQAAETALVGPAR